MAKSPIKLKVASPCAANWDEMKGDDAIRHCGACNKKVYQISNMSSEQVEEFLLSRRTRGLRTCVRFYQRADGTLLTSDCSVGKKRKRKKQVVSVFGAAAVSASAFGLSMGAQSSTTAPAALVEPATVVPPDIDEGLIMGEEVFIDDTVAPTPPEPMEMIQGGLVESPIEMLGDVE